MLQKECTRCRATKPASAFYRDSNCSDGLKVGAVNPERSSHHGYNIPSSSVIGRPHGIKLLLLLLLLVTMCRHSCLTHFWVV